MNWNLKDVEVNGYVLKKDYDKKQHTFYRVDVKRHKFKDYSVERRFKDFENLHNQLKKVVLQSTNGSQTLKFIDFPNNHLYTRTSKTFEFRRSSLDVYMKKLVDFYKDDLPIELVSFLMLHEQVEEQTNANSLNDENNGCLLQVPALAVKEADLNQVIWLTLSNKKDNVLRGVLNTFYS